MAAKGDKNEKSLVWIKVKSAVDLARAACTFDTYSKDLIATKRDGKDVLCLIGEDLNSSTIAYYVEEEHKESMAIYIAGPEGEEVSFSNTNEERLNATYINILPIESLPFNTSSKEDSILQIKVLKAESLIRSIIKKAVQKEEIESAYIFEFKNKTYIGAFDVIYELTDSKKTCYYSEIPNYEESGFIRYNYSKGAFEFAKNFGEHSYLYIKLINLEQPFPFFKG